MQPNAPVPLPDYSQQPPQYGPPEQPAPPRQPMIPTPGPYTTPPPRLSHNSGGGHAPILVLSFILTLVLLLGVAGFGLWAFMSRQDYKLHVDKKVAAAVDVAKKEEGVVKDKEFAEREKSPYKLYKTPATYGSVSVTYPKSWSAYVNESAVAGGGTPIDGYFHPNFVPGLQSGTAFALRVQIISHSYATEIKQYDGFVRSGKVRLSPYKAPKMPDITGARIDGEVAPGQTGGIVIFPLRDKTIKISTLSPQFVGDFNNTVLANLTFEP